MDTARRIEGVREIRAALVAWLGLERAAQVDLEAGWWPAVLGVAREVAEPREEPLVVEGIGAWGGTTRSGLTTVTVALAGEGRIFEVVAARRSGRPWRTILDRIRLAVAIGWAHGRDDVGALVVAAGLESEVGW